MAKAARDDLKLPSVPFLTKLARGTGIPLPDLLELCYPETANMLRIEGTPEPEESGEDTYLETLKVLQRLVEKRIAEVRTPALKDGRK